MAGGLNNLAQTLGKTDANGALIVTLAAGSSVVTSVQGTANQILANALTTPQTGAVVLTIPSTFIAPGSIRATTTFAASDGALGAVAYGFASDAALGFWSPGANIIQMGGQFRNDSAVGFILRGGNALAFCNSGMSSTFDVSLTRVADHVLQFGPTTGFRIDGSVNGTMNILAFGGGDTAIVKANVINATGSFSANGTAGVTTFGPAAVASITVKQGIITAIS